MKFSNDTLSVLKNFSRINQSILFQAGNKLRTISSHKTVMAEATLTEDIPRTAGVYDIGRFLSTLSLFQDPDVEFENEQFVIRSGKSVLKYTYTAENMIVSPPSKNIVLPSEDAIFNTNSQVIDSVSKAADVLGLPEICFGCTNGTVYIAAVDTKNPTTDTFSTDVGSINDDTNFKMYVAKEYLRVLPFDYKITVSKKGMIHLHNDKVQYWVAGESK